MDEPLPSTPTGDTIHEETDDFIKSNPKDGNVVLTQPATDAPVTSLVLSTKPVNVEDPVYRGENWQELSNPSSLIVLCIFPFDLLCF